MRVIKPVPYVPSTHLVSTTATESVALYDPMVNYTVGQKVRAGNYIYTSITTPNTGNSPDAVNSAYWVRTSPTNSFAMFDDQVSTATTATTSLTVVIKPGIINSIGLFGLIGNSLTVTVRDGLAGPIVYNKVVNLDVTVMSDWYGYFFEPSVQLGEIVATDIPPYANAHMTITISAGAGSMVQIGSLAFGSQYTIGGTEYGANVGIIDFSRKDTDDFGTTTFVRRAFSKRISANVYLQNSQLNSVQRILSDLRATPCVWIGSEDPTFSPLLVYGFFREFSIDIAYPGHSYCSLEIEGLV